MHPIKMLLLTDGIFPFVMGGMQKHSYYLAKFLKQQGVEVHIAHCVFGNQTMPTHDELIQHGFDPAHVTCLQFPQSVAFPGHYVCRSAQYSRLLYQTFKHQLQDFDLVYAQGFTAWKWKNKTHPPIIVNLHGLEMFQRSYGIKDKLSKYLLRIPAYSVLKHATVVQSLGGKLDELIEKLVPKHKIWSCGIGIEDSWIKSPGLVHKPNKPIRFVFIGRFEQRKGLHVLMPVLQQLATNSEFMVDFIGPIPTHLQVKDPHFVYHGAVHKEEKLQSLLDNADVLLLPSLSEGMPTVILEAMARGLAIVASDVGAVEVMVTYKNGFLVPPANKEMLFKTLKSILSLSPDHILALKSDALFQVRKYAWQTQILAHVAFFKTLLSHNAK